MWLNMDRPDNLMVIDSSDVVRRPCRLGAPDGRDPAAAGRAVPGVPPAAGARARRRSACRTGRTTPTSRSDGTCGEACCLPRVTRPAAARTSRRSCTVRSTATTRCGRSTSSTATARRLPLVIRFHHALADGMALAEVLLSLTDADADRRPRGLEDSAAGERARHRLSASAARWPQPTTATVADGGLHLSRRPAAGAQPAALVDTPCSAAKTGHVADKLLLGSNPDSPLSGPPGVPSAPCGRSRVRSPTASRIGRLAGATVNDVLVAAVSGAINSYLRRPRRRRPRPHHDGPGEPAAGRTSRCRASSATTSRWCCSRCPPGCAVRSQRLSEAKRRMDAIKNSPEATLTFGADQRHRPHRAPTSRGWSSTSSPRRPSA